MTHIQLNIHDDDSACVSQTSCVVVWAGAAMSSDPTVRHVEPSHSSLR